MSEPQPPRDGGNISLGKAVKQVELEYMQHISGNGVAGHERASNLRADGFRALAPSAPGNYRKKFEALADGFGRVGLLDAERALEIHRHIIPRSKNLDTVSEDLLLDLATMRIRFDVHNINEDSMPRAIRSELESILTSLGLRNPDPEDPDISYVPKDVSFQDIIRYALSVDYDLNNLVELPAQT